MLKRSLPHWIARILVGSVFVVNVQSGIAFILRPSAYAWGFELSGMAGSYFVQAMGILFLMWNATYPAVILDPARHRLLFGVVIAQQVIGLAGEGWLLSGLPASRTILAGTAARFIAFDALALVALVTAFLLSRNRSQE